MGTWGPSLFSDDIANDLREDFRDAIADGLSPAEATDKILAEYRPDPADPSYAATVWLALAATQWRLGRLEVRVRDAALAAIDGGGAIAAWRGTKDESRRRRILADSRAQLLSPPPPPRQVRRNLPCTCDWQPGDLVAYRTLRGSQIILQVQMLHTDKGGTYPSLEVLDWLGPDLPTTELIYTLPFARATPAYLAGLHRSLAATPDLAVRMSRIMLLGLKANTMKGRFRTLGVRRLPPERRWPTSGNGVLLKDFDAYLGRVFGFL
jgi:hypothetical protein